jgi:hypothetical protein
MAASHGLRLTPNTAFRDSSTVTLRVKMPTVQCKKALASADAFYSRSALSLDPRLT